MNLAFFSTNATCETMNYPDFRKIKSEKLSYARHEIIFIYKIMQAIF